MNRILLRSDEVPDTGRVVLADGRAGHIATVLQPAVGDSIRIGVLNGPLGTGEVTESKDGRVELACRFESTVPAAPPVDLLLAMPRPKIMKRLWAPLASLGVGRIIITRAARVERNYFDTHWLDPIHYEPLLIEGLQQGGTTRMPKVHIARRFRPLVEDRLDALCPGTQRVVAHPDSVVSVRDLAPDHGQRLLLAVGPEGGWVPFELTLLEAAGFMPMNLPFGTLRTDVACIALLAIVGALTLP